MTTDPQLIPNDQIEILRPLIGARLMSYGTSHLLNGTRTAIGEAFFATDASGVVRLTSEMRSYSINGILEDFAAVSVHRGNESLVDVASKGGGTFYDFSNSIITNLGIIRTEFSREVSGRPKVLCMVDLGLLIVTEVGRVAIFNGSIWVNEFDLEALRADSELSAPEGFASELGDVWESATTCIMIGR